MEHPSVYYHFSQDWVCMWVLYPVFRQVYLNWLFNGQTKSPPILNLYLIAKWYSTQHDIPVTKFCISILIFQEFVCLLYKSHLEEIKSLQQQDILHILFSKALHCSTVKVIGILNSQHDKFETQTWTHIVPGTPGNWLWRICA